MTIGLDETSGLVGDERSLVVLVLRVVAGDELAADLLGPEVLRTACRVVGDDRVGGVEDALAGAVVLLHDDDRRLGEELLELHQVAEIGSAELVDRVVGDESLGHEVVRARDVEVVDGDVEVDGLHRRDDVEGPVVADHHHAPPHRRGRQERQQTRTHSCDRMHGHAARRGDAMHDVLDGTRSAD